MLAGSFLYLVVANLIWIWQDTRPPFWDMAYHQTAALRILDAFTTGGVASITAVPELTGFYPPLYHSIVAAFYRVCGPSVDAAQLANIPAIALLFLAHVRNRPKAADDSDVRSSRCGIGQLLSFHALALERDPY